MTLVRKSIAEEDAELGLDPARRKRIVEGLRIKNGLDQASLNDPEVQLSKEWPEGFPVYSPHRYILELRKGKQQEDAVTLSYVSSIQMQQPHSLDRRWTLSRVYEQSSGSRERLFSIAGRTGDQPLDITRFFKLRNFLEKYFDLKRKTENAFSNSRAYSLVMNFTWEGERFECSIINFSYQRESGNTTNSYVWNLTLATNNYIVVNKAAPQIYDSRVLEYEKATIEERKAAIELESADDMKAPTANSGYKNVYPADAATGSQKLPGGDVISKNSNSVKKANNKVLGAKAGSASWYEDLAAANYTYTSAFIEASDRLASLSLTSVNIYRRAITPTISAMNSMAYSVSRMVGATVGILPDAKLSVISTKADAVRAVEVLKAAWQELSILTTEAYWNDLFPGVVGNSGLRGSRLTVVVENANTPVLAQPAPSGNSQGGGTGTQDAYNLAGIFLGDRNRWRDIMLVNRMPDPYTKEDGSPLLVGDIILIPDEDGTPAAKNNTTANELTFGSDLMVKDGDLVMRGLGGLEVVRGEANLNQSISHRLRTVRGTNRIFPNFGLPQFISEKQTSTLAAQVWSEIQAQVSADRRVGAVIKILIDEQPMVYQVGIILQMLNHQTLSASFEYTPS
jgi:hypothetical protein